MQARCSHDQVTARPWPERTWWAYALSAGRAGSLACAASYPETAGHAGAALPAPAHRLSPFNLDGLALDAESQRAAIAALARQLYAQGEALVEIQVLLATLLQRAGALEAG